jgi:hypothetical protein
MGDLLRPLVTDRVFVLVGAPVRPLLAEAEVLLDLGAGHVMIVGDGVGSVVPPERDRRSWLTLEVSGETVSAARHRAAAQLSALPAQVTVALDRVDPDASAWVVNANNVCTAARIGGRRLLGRSRSEWTAPEDKTTCDELWDAAGVARVRCESSRSNVRICAGRLTGSIGGWGRCGLAMRVTPCTAGRS